MNYANIQISNIKQNNIETERNNISKSKLLNNLII
jgi:hypothetical protein